MTPDMEVQRGEQAKELLDNPLFVESYDKIEAEIKAAWEASPVRDVEGREKLYQMLMIARKFKAHFESVVNTGKMARRTLSEVVTRQRL
jgi:hypothetical protein